MKNMSTTRSAELAQNILDLLNSTTQGISQTYGLPLENAQQGKINQRKKMIEEQKKSVLQDKNVSIAEACIEAVVAIAMRDENRDIQKDEFISMAYSYYNRAPSGNSYPISKDTFSKFISISDGISGWIPVEGNEEEKRTLLSRNIFTMLKGLILSYQSVN